MTNITGQKLNFPFERMAANCVLCAVQSTVDLHLMTPSGQVLVIV